MTGIDEELLGKLLLPDNLWDEKPIKHFIQNIQVSIHHYYINGEITEKVDRYVDMLNTLKIAEAHDKIFIYLNTPGGDVNTTIQIISAMKISAAEVTTVIEGEVCSAGTFIFLAGDNYIVNENCSFMIHNYSHGMYGKGAEVASRIKFSEQYFRELAKSVYKTFLTDEEIQKICEDKDIWMGSKELTERLRKLGDDKVVTFLQFEEELEPKVKPKVKPKTRRSSKTSSK